MFFKTNRIKKDKLLIKETTILSENFSNHIKESNRLGLISGKELQEAKDILTEISKIYKENLYKFEEWNNGGDTLDSISRKKLYRLNKYLSQHNAGRQQGKDAFENWKNQSQSKLDDNMKSRIRNSMYEDWINKKVLKLIEQIRYSNNSNKLNIDNNSD